jgi:hypothetical protein
VPLARIASLLAVVALAACATERAAEIPAPGPPEAAPSPAPRPRRGPPREPHVAPNGDQAKITGTGLTLVRAAGGTDVVDASELHPPPGEPALLAILPTALLYLDDGTLLVGVGDGTVTALDAAGRRRWSLGLRGAVRRLVPVSDGLAVVTTNDGVVALLGGDGRLRWQRQPVPDALDALEAPGGLIVTASVRGIVAYRRSGELAFSHAAAVPMGDVYGKVADVPAVTLDDDVLVARELRVPLAGPHVPIASVEPTFPLTFRRVLPRPIHAMIADGTGFIALSGGGEAGTEVVRIEGDRVTPLAVPTRSSRTHEATDDDGKNPRRVRSWLWLDALATGPTGEPWILGRRRSIAPGDWQAMRMGIAESAGQILALRGAAFAEWTELDAAFTEHPFEMFGHRTLVAPPGRARAICFGGDKPVCQLHDGSRFHLVETPEDVAAVGVVGDAAWLVTGGGQILRSTGTALVPVEGPGVAVSTVSGTSERDVWAVPADGARRVFHGDGSTWVEVSVPGEVKEVVARAPDDAWSSDGRVHWDGKRWSLVHGPRANVVIPRGAGDVWLGASDGLWHGTAAGRPPVVQIPAPAAEEDGALAPTPPLVIGGIDDRWQVERVSFPVGGAPSPPLATGGAGSSARAIAAAPDGSLWVALWDRLVRWDGAGAATTIRAGERLAYRRWFHPGDGKRGIVLDRRPGMANQRDVIELVEAGAKKPLATHRIDDHDAVAVDAHPRGATWIAGSFTTPFPDAHRGVKEPELGVHALVRAAGEETFRPVLGLPSAAFLDVAATGDGGAWFAGALNSGPMGEGILFRARGALGQTSSSRWRAPSTLLAVTAVGDDEAWAVGAAGAVVHVVRGVVSRFTLPSGAWLRAVAATGPDDVWIAGDGGTLLHHDGKTVRSVAHPLGPRAVFTGLAFARDALWAVSPSGIVRVTRRP